MRAALSLLALVIVAAIVLSMVKKQATALKPSTGASAASAAAPALPAPEAVGQRVQSSIDEAARKAAEAASAATN